MAIDKSGYKEKAMSSALALAKFFSSEITVIHVINRPSMIAAPRVPPAAVVAQRELLEVSQREADQLLDDIVLLGKGKGVKIRTQVLEGSSVQQTILDYAKAEQFDLIVIGTRGMTGITRFLIGSVATDVIARAHCPVLAVR